MKRIFYITSVDPQVNTGGSIIRRGSIHYFKKAGFNVIVVKPGDVYSYNENEGYCTIPGLSYSRINYTLEALGVVRDKDIKWSINIINYLKQIVGCNDLLFVTTGGSMAPIIAGDKLKNKTGARLVVNYHDPTNFTTLAGNLYAKTYHVNRDKTEVGYMKSIDYIITSSEAYKNNLLLKYPFIKDKIKCCYFGYIDPFKTCSARNKKKYINIVYGGNMGPIQAPEILAEAVQGIKSVKATFVGRYKTNERLLKYQNSENVEMLESRDLRSYYQYLDSQADIGFFSLRTYLANYCVPSKLFDYINLELPMLAIVKGDAKDIIEKNHYGLVAMDTVESLHERIIEMCDSSSLEDFHSNLVRDKHSWSMQEKSEEMIRIINQM